jgi:transcriptional regulator with XRE-family HTH domain
MTEKYISLIATLKKFRQKSDLSQKEVSALLAKPQSYLSKIENLNQELLVNDLFSLCVIYKVKAKDIFELVEGEYVND